MLWKKSNIVTDIKSKENNIKIIITGDFCPVNRIEKLSIEKDFHRIYGDSLDLLKDADLAITNLECPLTTRHRPIPKAGPNLVAHPDTIHGITHGGFHAVTLANNHIFDQGSSGLMDTIDVCKQNNISFVGAGSNLDEASVPLYKIIKDKNIAVLNFAEKEFGIAGKNKPGANPLDPISNYTQIKQAKAMADHVFVVIHGGHETYNLPSPRMKNTYRFFADLGVDAVIGHHTHCASGFEIYKDVPIFYSLGNFIFDWPGKVDEDWNEGYFIIFKINQNGILTFEIAPYQQNNNEPGLMLMKGEDKKSFLKKLDSLSNIISDNEHLEAKWSEFCKTRANGYFYNLVSPNRLIRRLVRKKVFRDSYFAEKYLLNILNIIRCQSHRDLIVESLERRTNKINT